MAVTASRAEDIPLSLGNTPNASSLAAQGDGTSRCHAKAKWAEHQKTQSHSSTLLQGETEGAAFPQLCSSNFI